MNKTINDDKDREIEIPLTPILFLMFAVLSTIAIFA